MSEHLAFPFKAGDRVATRDQIWRVDAACPYSEGRVLLRLLPAGANGAQPLTVVIPPERVVALAPEELIFDPALVGPIKPWHDAHRALLLTAVHDDALSGARFGRVTPEAYQVAPVVRILAKPAPRLLIADDVGLGKTIEAGLCLIELMQRRRASRVLVVVPPGLVSQWEDELLQRFGLEFTVIENAAGLARVQTGLPAGLSPWDLPAARIITSVDYLKKHDICRRALAKPWDLVIVDEAHALAESGTPNNPYRTRRTRLGERLRDNARGLLLLTATPHNGYSHSFRSLIELVEPTAATLASERLSERMERAMIRRMKRQIRRQNAQGEWVPAFLKRTVAGIPVHASPEEAQLFGLITVYCSRTLTAARGTEEQDLVSFAMQVIKKRAISSRLALGRTIDHRLSALKREGEREEKPQRADLRDLRAGIAMTDHQAERIARRILRSAIPADERLRKAEIRQLTELKRLLGRLPRCDPKIGALLDYLEGVFTADPAAKVIVFTEYLDTLEAIRLALDASDSPARGAYVELRGGLTQRQREHVQGRFEAPDVRALLATDAASEGLNLQRVCHRLVHFELPWNPNRLEQRNGRIDRYGQTHAPDIRYFYYPDSPEDDVLARLVAKIEEMAESRISTPDVLGVLSGMDLEERLTQMSATDARTVLVRDFEDRTREFSSSVVPLVLVDVDPTREIALTEAVLAQAEPLLPDDLELEGLLATVLGPRAFHPVEADGVYRVEVPRVFRGPEVAERYERATCRRSVAARTRPHDVEYLTPLHPLVQAIAAHARRQLLQIYPDDRGLPPRRLAARRVPAAHVPAILFTFYGRLTGADGVIEEQVVPVRMDLTGRPMGDASSDLDVLAHAADNPGEVPSEALALFRERFAALAEAARAEAHHRLLLRAEEIRRRRRSLAEALRADTEAYRVGRLRELEEEAAHARGLIQPTGQMLLWTSEERACYSVNAKRAAVDTFVKQRYEEIAAFEHVDDPTVPAPLGALFLVPEGH